jgi:hypothetical protein
MGSLVLFGAATSMAFCLPLGLEAPGRAAPMVKPWDKLIHLGTLRCQMLVAQQRMLALCCMVSQHRVVNSKLDDLAR